MSVEASLKEFKETAGTESFQMQGSKMVKVQLKDETIQAKLGSMVAYQGDVSWWAASPPADRCLRPET